ncbi:ATP-binding cassette domain-containing protein [Spongorhabdus nitratireducens]
MEDIGKKDNGIDISALEQSHQNSEILNIPQLQIRPGETICLQGENGSGKTSLLRVMAGLGKNCKGSVSVLGQNLASIKYQELERLRADYIGFVFQYYRLVPYLSAFDNIMLPCHFSARRRREAIGRAAAKHIDVPSVGQRKDSAIMQKVSEDAFRLIRKLSLKDPSRLSKNASDYSAGQQQRFAIARALIGNPRLVLVDEPASAMDTKGKRAVYELILNECRETGATLVCTTHDDMSDMGFDRYLDMGELNLAKEPEIR